MSQIYTDDLNYFIVPIDNSFEGFQRQLNASIPVGLKVFAYSGLGILPVLGLTLILHSSSPSMGWISCIFFLISILAIGLTRLQRKKSYTSNKLAQQPLSIFLFDTGFVLSNDYLTYSDIPATEHEKILSRMYSQTIPYNNLYSIHRSKNDFYFLETKSTVYTIKKSSCSPNTLQFLNTLKYSLPQTAINTIENRQPATNINRLHTLSVTKIPLRQDNHMSKNAQEFADDINYFLIPLDTSANGFYKLSTGFLPKWLKPILWACIPALLVIAVVYVLQKNYNLSLLFFVLFLIPCFAPWYYRRKLKELYNSSKLLQAKRSIFLFESGFSVTNLYLAYSDIPPAHRETELNMIYTHTVPYENLYTIGESKEKYYLFISINSGYAVKKSDCSPNAQAFLSNLKAAVYSRKKQKK